MSVTQVLDLFRRQARAVRETTESWKNDHDQAQLALQADALLGITLDIARGVYTSYDRTWASFGTSHWSQHDLNEYGQEFTRFLLEMIDILKEATDYARQFERLGFPLERSGELEKTLNRMERLHSEHAQRWPFFTTEDEHRAGEEIARGEGLPVDEAFAAIAGVGQEAWAQRVEEHKRKYHPELP